MGVEADDGVGEATTLEVLFDGTLADDVPLLAAVCVCDEEGAVTAGNKGVDVFELAEVDVPWGSCRFLPRRAPVHGRDDGPASGCWSLKGW